MPAEPLHVLPLSVEEVGEAVRSAPGRVLPRGGGAKPALSVHPATLQAESPVTIIEMGGLSGITEYNPSEYTISARAGTRLSEIVTALAAHGQGLPFDPPLVEAGATLGGAIAAGLSGPGRVRYGGLRDFLLGVTVVDGTGVAVRGGGRVVKNAAGLDLPRLLVGSIGRLGILTEATFKVFPTPAAEGTVRLPAASLRECVLLMQQVADAQLDLDGLEIDPVEPALYVRLGGLTSILPQRLEAVTRTFGGELAVGAREAGFWRSARELTWADPSYHLARIALLPQRIGDVDAIFASLNAQRRYSAGGVMAWVAWDPVHDVATVDGILNGLGLSAILLRGPAESPLIGLRTGGPFLARIRPVLDPAGRFLPL